MSELGGRTVELVVRVHGNAADMAGVYSAGVVRGELERYQKVSRDSANDNGLACN
jgi:hypothetical protein